MDETSKSARPPSGVEIRKERLAKALRDNLKRRKHQARERSRGESGADRPHPTAETSGRDEPSL